MTTIDLTALDALLANTSWPRSKLEDVLGVSLSGPVPIETKRLIWQLINDEKARAAVDRVRLVIPQAQVTAIHTA